MDRETILETVFAGPWLGHGRATECRMAAVSILYGIFLLASPDSASQGMVTEFVPREITRLLPLPILLQGTLTAFGLWFNIVGYPGSQVLRFSGALLATIIFSSFTVAYLDAGAVANWGFCYVSTGIYFAVRTMTNAWAGLPKPGAPGVR